ncbi:MAG: BamA/TamA family outer membrane protein [Bacteroidota bacterium]|nr:BamA/TamA family outer membrane protein [Bacteroidota bacterium]
MINSRKFLLLITLYICVWFSALGQRSPQVPLKTDSLKAKHKNSFLVAPLIGTSVETNWQFGFASAFIFKTNRSDSTLRTSTIPLGFLYTLNQQILVNFGANIYFPKEKYFFRMDNSYSKYPEFFWGIGNDKTNSGKYELYTFSQYSISPQVHRSIVKHVFAGLGLEHQRVYDIFYHGTGIEPSLFVKDNVRGVIDRSFYMINGASFYLSYDSRNNAYAPDKGIYFRLKFSEFSRFTYSDYVFSFLDADGRVFIKLFPKHILGFNYVSLFNFGDVPYRNFAQLGSSFIMRGYYQGRFRDRNFIGGQTEYRFPIFWKFGGVVFVGTGQVFGNFLDYTNDKLKISVGTGIRFELLPKEKLNLRFDVGWGNNNQFNYYLTVGESF